MAAPQQGTTRPGYRLRTLVALVPLLALAAGARGSDFADDLAARRARVMERLGPEAMLILWSAPTVRATPDVDAEYSQDSNLYYLTGLAQAETMLVLMPGNDGRREVLFVRERNAAEEHWTGRLLSVDDARAKTGIDTVLTSGQFEPFVAAMLDRRGFGPIDAPHAARFHDALAAGRATVHLVLPPNRGIGSPLAPPLQFARQIRDRFVGFTIVDAARTMADLRVIKTPYERALLVRSFAISTDAQLAGMRAARPGAHEYEVKAAVEAVHRGRGAAPAYPSIVGSGPNATILHYPEGARRMEAGDLLLVDAACRLEYMSGDVTRTYPVSGTFTPAQRDIYQIVLEAQEAAIRAARPGASLRDVHQRSVEAVRAGLLRLGLLTDPAGEQYRLWYTHGGAHYIGIDVHDVGALDRPLASGMAFAIEPGIYIRQAALDALPRTPENIAFIARVQPAVSAYADIGVRIEDSFLLEESGLRNLSAALPKTIAGIEELLGRRSAGTR